MINTDELSIPRLPGSVVFIHTEKVKRLVKQVACWGELEAIFDNVDQRNQPRGIKSGLDDEDFLICR